MSLMARSRRFAPWRHLTLAALALPVLVVCAGSCDKREALLQFRDLQLGLNAIEQPVTVIALSGELQRRDAEISGLCWYGDHLIILPQYPYRFPSGEAGTVFTLSKAEIVAYLDSASPEPLTPRRIPFAAPGLADRIPGFEGYEAIACDGETVYLTIEAQDGKSMRSFLVKGRMTSDLSLLSIDTDRYAEIPAQTDHGNMAYEAIVFWAEKIVAIHEINGANLNPEPRAYLFDTSLRELGAVPCPTLEYRITDATAADAENRFWIVNFFFPGDQRRLRPGPDDLADKYGLGPTHKECVAVERLVEYRLADDCIIRTGAAPVQLQLIGDAQCRNWEGLVRLDDRGFLLMTDKYPATILAFVPAP